MSGSTPAASSLALRLATPTVRRTPLRSFPICHRYEEGFENTAGFMVILHTTRFGRQVWLQVLWDT